MTSLKSLFYFMMTLFCPLTVQRVVEQQQDRSNGNNLSEVMMMLIFKGRVILCLCILVNMFYTISFHMNIEVSVIHH